MRFAKMLARESILGKKTLFGIARLQKFIMRNCREKKERWLDQEPPLPSTLLFMSS